MKNIFKTTLGIFLATTLVSFSPVDDCSIMHDGIFRIADIEENVTVVIDGSTHFEYYQEGYLESEINWVNDCEFEMTLKKVTLPNFPFEVGVVMHVRINQIDGNKIYYTAIIEGVKADGVLLKVK